MAGKRAKAPPGCFWRRKILYGRTRSKGKLIVWSLETDDPRIAARRRLARKDQIVAISNHDANWIVAEIIPRWQEWLKGEVSKKTITRYLVSIGQIGEFIISKDISEIDGHLVGDIIERRTSIGATNATIKRDLSALSSLCRFAIARNYREDNPVLPRMSLIKERRDPIFLPRQKDIDLVMQRAPGMIKDMMSVAIVTGAREDELLKAKREDIDDRLRQITVIGKRNKRRVIDLEPFGGHNIIRRLRVNGDLLFWHGNGESYKNFASQFSAVVDRTVAWAKKEGVDFKRFRFHHLRHLHAVNWLKDRRSLYDLQKRLGHTSIKTTEIYLEFLTPEEERAVKGLAA